MLYACHCTCGYAGADPAVVNEGKSCLEHADNITKVYWLQHSIQLGEPHVRRSDFFKSMKLFEAIQALEVRRQYQQPLA